MADAAAKRRITQRWWWPTAVVLAAVASLYLAGATGLLDAIGNAIEWARQTNCDVAGAVGSKRC